MMIHVHTGGQPDLMNLVVMSSIYLYQLNFFVKCYVGFNY